MTKRRGQKIVAREKVNDYQKVAEHFYQAAMDSIELEYFTAAGVLIVHSAIAFTDAITIKYLGLRSIGEDHEIAVKLIGDSVIESSENSLAINQLKRIIEEKTKVSYLGELYSKNQTSEMWKRLERYRKWANSILKK